jgi:hypothetical protein
MDCPIRWNRELYLGESKIHFDNHRTQSMQSGNLMIETPSVPRRLGTDVEYRGKCFSKSKSPGGKFISDSKRHLKNIALVSYAYVVGDQGAKSILVHLFGALVQGRSAIASV